jgi:hypothetical protein
VSSGPISFTGNHNSPFFLQIYCRFFTASSDFCRPAVTGDWLAVREGEADEQLALAANSHEPGNAITAYDTSSHNLFTLLLVPPQMPPAQLIWAGGFFFVLMRRMTNRSFKSSQPNDQPQHHG